MRIEYLKERRIFRLFNDETEYTFAVTADGRLINLHWGAPVGSAEAYDGLLSDNSLMNPGSHGYCRAEIRTGEAFDFGEPCLRVRFADGAETLRLRYRGYKAGKNKLSVFLFDEYYPLEVELKYQMWGELPLIGRSVILKNTGEGEITLLSAKSATYQLPRGRVYRLTHFAGECGAEYQKNQTMLNQSAIVLGTRYLTDAASHQVPFFALDEEGHSTEDYGEVYFGMLQWSGDFAITCEMLHTQTIKNVSVTGGINDSTSHIPLKGGESFATPAFTSGYSSRGFGRMSEILYDWQLDYQLPCGAKGDKAHAERPVIYNTWYPYLFDIDEKKLIDFIPKVKYIGAELFVIDDGWMKGRTDDKRGLGDWVIDMKRFPRGLGYIADEVHKSGMLFGLWVEPEMVNPDSDLYRSHPDWVLSEPNRERSLQRTQLILDMSRDDIRDWAIEWLDKLIVEAKLDYLKWDMNREVSEIGLFAIERGIAVKYIRNIEYIWKHLNDKFPDLLLENCASGGGRADFGMAPYADRVNRSDNADPIDVMLIHEGYSTLFLPKLAGGAGNVSPSPYYLSGRSIPLDFRINSGMTGSMSVGVNLLESDQNELDTLKKAIARFKLLRPALQDSYVYRIASVADKHYSVLEYLRRDKSSFTVFVFAHGLHQWERQLPLVKMRGLEPSALYVCEDRRMTGAALMNLGFDIPLSGDYSSKVYTWVRT